jgi:hypothetical protein
LKNSFGQTAGSPSIRYWLVGLLAFLLLNASLGFNNIWPTPAIKPDARLAPEFVWFWVFLFLVVRYTGRVRPSVLTICALAFTSLIVGRYVDVTVPSLFGRPLNLYWDGNQLPRFLSVASQSFPAWQLVLMVLGLVVLLWTIYRLVKSGWGTLANKLMPALVHNPVAIILTMAAAGLAVANHAGVQATWPYVSRPVVPTYARQVDLLLTAYLPSRLAKVLPPSPAFDTNVKGLNGADLSVIFFESYGAVTYDDPDIAARVSDVRSRLQTAADDSGQQVYSGFVTAATFGGASDLSHLSLLSGIDLSNPLRHDVLLTTDRPTLITMMQGHGYESVGLYPALSWAWPEKSYYNFDIFVDGPLLKYRGPKFGLWWIPDQYTIAQFEHTHPITEQTPPRFLFFSTVTSHAPFRPTPPYQPDWSRVISADPYNADEAAAAMADTPDWNDMSGYTDTIIYTLRWLADYVKRPRPRPQLLVVVGDHQPVGRITGPNARWEVPVHIFTADPGIADHLVSAGFVAGITPDEKVIGGLHDLTAILTRAFHREGDGPLQAEKQIRDTGKPVSAAPRAIAPARTE